MTRISKDHQTTDHETTGSVVPSRIRGFCEYKTEQFPQPACLMDREGMGLKSLVYGFFQALLLAGIASGSRGREFKVEG